MKGTYMITCPVCNREIADDEGKNHLRSLAELKSGVLICNNFMCITMSGGTEALKATSGKMTDE